jgi:hypothetical protein
LEETWGLSMYTSIEIDFDVYKELTVRRNTPRSTENDVIRELLGLAPVGHSDVNSDQDQKQIAGNPWAWKGVTLHDGTELRASRGGRTHKARIENGAILCNGKRYRSPSTAAGAVTGNSVNGWTFWECKIPGRDWVPMAKLRSVANEDEDPQG